MPVEVIRTITSVGSSIAGSGTVSTRTSRLPCQVTAFMGPPRPRGCGRRVPAHGPLENADRPARLAAAARGRAPLHAGRRHRGNGQRRNRRRSGARGGRPGRLRARDRAAASRSWSCRRSSGRAPTSRATSWRRCSTARTRWCISPGGSSRRTASASSGRRTCTGRRASSRPPRKRACRRSCTGRRSASTRPGPKHERVDESWPRNGVRTSFYGRHKAEAEWRLDAVESANPELRVVRIRPGLVFQRDGRERHQAALRRPAAADAAAPTRAPAGRPRRARPARPGGTRRRRRARVRRGRRPRRARCVQRRGRARARCRSARRRHSAPGRCRVPVRQPRALSPPRAGGCTCSRARRAGSTWRSAYR